MRIRHLIKLMRIYCTVYTHWPTDSPRLQGEPSRPQGESPRTQGGSPRPQGEPPRTQGEPPWAPGWASCLNNEPPRPQGEPPWAQGEPDYGPIDSLRDFILSLCTPQLPAFLLRCADPQQGHADWDPCRFGSRSATLLSWLSKFLLHVNTCKLSKLWKTAVVEALV
jgi:hypothetical protein